METILYSPAKWLLTTNILKMVMDWCFLVGCLYSKGRIRLHSLLSLQKYQ